MSAIKINSTKNIRKGAIFHYAPFILHCLFPEIINEVYQYDTVYREKVLDKTIGKLSKIYDEVMEAESIELDTIDYNNLDLKTIECEFNRSYLNRVTFDRFRDYVFSRYNINPLDYDDKYPEVLLIKRSDRVELIDDDQLKDQLPKAPINKDEQYIDGYQLHNASPEALRYHFLVSNGKDRREIDRVDDVESYLQYKYRDRFKSVMFEFLPFLEQIKYYNNAKIIISVHGGCQVNQLFCKEQTKIVEIEANGKKFEPFDQISNILNLNHVKCRDNKFESIVNFIENEL